MKNIKTILFLALLSSAPLIPVNKTANENEETIGFLKIRVKTQDGAELKYSLACKVKPNSDSIDIKLANKERILEYLKSIDNIEKIYAKALINKEFQENYEPYIKQELENIFNETAIELDIESNKAHA